MFSFNHYEDIDDIFILIILYLQHILINLVVIRYSYNFKDSI